MSLFTASQNLPFGIGFALIVAIALVEGLGMLLHQAVRGFSLWFGVTPRITPELYGLVARDIDPAYPS